MNDGVDAQEIVNKLAEKNIRISGMGQGKLRIVTHLDYSDPMHEQVLSALKKL